MEFPVSLKTAIEQAASQFSLSSLAQAAQELSQNYRNRQPQQSLQPQHKKLIRSAEQQLAYTIFRMPATYAAISRVCLEIQRQIPEFQPKNLLDLGSGPGTVMWAALEHFSGIEQISLIEQDPDLIALGKIFQKQSDHFSLQNASWQQEDLLACSSFPTHDMVVISYAIGEMDLKAIPALLEKIWNATRQVAVIIEPGTPHGFQRILTARQTLIDLKAHLVAPCPHSERCPLSEVEGHWCHFSQRLERSFLQRYVKGGTLGFEDEKFSYVVAAKIPAKSYRARIVGHPMKHSGHLSLELCTAEGLKKETISRKHGEFYKQARHLEWGDCV